MSEPCATARVAEQLKRSPDATTFERANAAFVAKDYAEAERLALNAAEEAQKADPSRTADRVKALELAGWSAENQIGTPGTESLPRCCRAYQSPARCAGMDACAV